MVFSFLFCMVTVDSRAKEQDSQQEKKENYSFDETLYAQSAVLMDADSGRVLFGQKEEQIMPMASTTKIMTLIVALENANLEDLVTVSKYAASMPDVQLNIRENEQYYLKDLLYSLMLESHNDSAVAIAEHVGGSVEGFAQYMNQKARDIGCTDTYFVTPNGLDATATIKTKDGETITKAHATTAKDLAQILRYCIELSPKKEQFLEITRTGSYSFSNQSGSRSFQCNNHNAFLQMMDGALTGKTGFTGKAGYCYVGALTRDDKTYIIALLACGWPNNKSYKWSDAKKLFNYGIDNFEYHTFDEQPINQEKLKPVYVIDGKTERIGQKAQVRIEEVPELSGGMLLRNDETFEVKYEIKDVLQAPVSKGMAIGSITYLIQGQKWKSIPLFTAEAIESIDYAWCIKQILQKFCISFS